MRIAENFPIISEEKSGSSFHLLKNFGLSMLTYLASPYSNPDPYLRNVRFYAACRVAAELISSGIPTISPIAHAHPIATATTFHLGEAGLGWESWKAIDFALLGACDSLLVLRLEGWDRSVGVQAEVARARELRLRIGYIELDNLFPVWETRVVNVRHQKCDRYCGRAIPRRGFKASPFANPYKSPRDGTPAECVEKYRLHLRSRPDLIALARSADYKGLDLGCWCVELGKDVPCHVNIVAAVCDGQEP